MSDDISTARLEVHRSLNLCNFCTRKFGISYTDDLPTTFFEKLKINCLYIISLVAFMLLIAAEFAFVTSLLIGSGSIEKFIAGFHLMSYACMSVCKILMLWIKKSLFRKVVNELVELWPVSTEDHDAATLKRRTLSALRLGQMCYMFWNFVGLSLYSLTPVILHIYHLLRGLPTEQDFIWFTVYPFDKTKPVVQQFVIIYELFTGSVAVWGQLGSDLIFTSMASHISMLLRLLQLKIRKIGTSNTIQRGSETNYNMEHQNSEENSIHVDSYDEIVSLIKIHQRLINYSKDLEDVFSVVNLINVLLISVNICCSLFNIVLVEPWMEMQNKTFLVAVLTQVGMLCWYADDIFRASVGVADAVYESGWYKTNTRSRRALLLLLQRSQKPLYFTTLKFRSITMTTYTSILTTSYSYFALLYTMYRN